MINSPAVDVAALIGDVVGSRQHADRAALHARLATALERVTRTSSWVTPPRITVGDEFQGSLPDVGAALGAVWDLRVALLPQVDVRFGIGLGRATVLDQEELIEDGDAWWAARAAIEQVKEEQRGPGGRTRRVDLGVAPGSSLAFTVPALRAGLVATDALLAQLDEVDLVLLRALRAGATQAEAAARVGLAQPSVSHRVNRRGLGTLLRARSLLDERT